jgi:hypothetical protein
MRNVIQYGGGGLIVGALAVFFAAQVGLFGLRLADPEACPSDDDVNKCVEVINVVGGPPTIRVIGDGQVHKSGTLIRWKIGKASYKKGYRFAPDGIVFVAKTVGDKTYPPAPAGEFVRCAPDGEGRRFQCEDTYQSPGPWGYKVKLAGSAPHVDPLDPFILNN